MHHFDGAAGETESHRPERALARPICYLIECGSVSEGIVSLIVVYGE